jgi:hypothetical protein
LVDGLKTLAGVGKPDIRKHYCFRRQEMSADVSAPQRSKTEDNIGEEIEKAFPTVGMPVKANPEKVKPVAPAVRNHAIDSNRRRIEDPE